MIKMYYNNFKVIVSTINLRMNPSMPDMVLKGEFMVLLFLKSTMTRFNFLASWSITESCASTLKMNAPSIQYVCLSCIEDKEEKRRSSRQLRNMGNWKSWNIGFPYRYMKLIGELKKRNILWGWINVGMKRPTQRWKNTSYLQVVEVVL